MAWWVQVQNFLTSKWYAILNLAGLLLVVVAMFLVVIWAVRGRSKAR